MAEEVIPPVVPEVVPPTEPEVVLPSDQEEFVVPEKFEGKSLEDVIKSYQELEAMKPKDDPEPPKDHNEEPPKDDATTTQDLIEEYAARGTDLTEEDYQTLEEKGYSKRQVDLYKAGYQAEQAQAAVALLESAGTTADEASNAAEWARENWSAERVTQYNAAIEAASPDIQVTMIQMLTEQFRTSGTKPPEADPLHASSKPAPTTKGYTSMEQLIADQSDPRYDQRSFAFDKAYYDAVRTKAGKSTF